MEEVRENKAERKKLIKRLKQHKIAFRIISKTININREKLRREYNKEQNCAKIPRPLWKNKNINKKQEQIFAKTLKKSEKYDITKISNETI